MPCKAPGLWYVDTMRNEDHFVWADAICSNQAVPTIPARKYYALTAVFEKQLALRLQHNLL